MAKNIITSFTIQVLLLIDNLMSVEQLPVQTEAYYKSILIPMSNDQYSGVFDLDRYSLPRGTTLSVEHNYILTYFTFLKHKHVP